MMLKTGVLLVLTLTALAISATFLPGDALQTIETWFTNHFEEHSVSESDKVLTNIFRVDMTLSESKPPKVSLDVEGEHPDGCEYPVIVSQSREGNIVNVEVYREVPVDVFCPMILKPYRGTITLDGSFEPGEYTINVNTHSQAVEV